MRPGARCRPRARRDQCPRAPWRRRQRPVSCASIVAPGLRRRAASARGVPRTLSGTRVRPPYNEFMTVTEISADPQEAEFQRLIDADQRIEPRDWMPDAYR